MFSHVMVGTNDLERAKRFYDALMGTLGVAPAALIRAIDSRTEVPAEMTSSTMRTRPATGAPTIGDRDIILYALALGAPSTQLDLVYERELRALPTYACALGLWAVEAAGRLGAYDPKRSLHASQRLVVHQPLPTDGTVQMTGQIAAVYDKGQASFEATAARGATFSCLDQHLLASYAAAVNHPDARRLLAARGLLDRSDHPTAGVVLLFGSEPEQWFPEAHVRVLRYAGSERGTG